VDVQEEEEVGEVEDVTMTEIATAAATQTGTEAEMRAQANND
jgi:hypothetical protein